MSSSSPTRKDESWYVNVDCPKYFDFNTALQAPCSNDLSHNPPLHDFVYESDDESRRFFRSASIHTFSPRPKQPQQPLLDPREFGDPVYRHRPEMSFEEFLSDFETRKKTGASRQSNIDQNERTPCGPQQPRRAQQASSSLREIATTSLKKPRGLGRLRYLNGEDNEEDQDHTIDLKTPTLDSIITPISIRRHTPLLTPSRIFHPVNISKELFPNSFDSASSPVVKQSESGTTVQGVSHAHTESFDSPPLGSSNSTDDRQVNAYRTKTPVNARPSTPRKNETPLSKFQLRSGEMATVTSEMGSANMHKPSDKVIAKPAPEQKIRLPRRAARVSSSTTSTKSSSPALLFSTTASGSKERSASKDSDNTRYSPNLTSECSTELSTRPHKQSSKETSPTTEYEQSELASLGDSDLLRRLHEHNMRLRSSEDTANDDEQLSPSDDGKQIQSPEEHDEQAELLRSAEDVIRRTRIDNKQAQRLRSDQAGIQPARRGNVQPRSLNELLQMENDRVLRERRQKQPERRRIVQANKDTVLKRAERNIPRPHTQRQRISTTVEFTSVSAPTGTSVEHSREVNASLSDQKPTVQVGSGSTSIKSTPPIPPPAPERSGQNRNPNLPSSRTTLGSNSLSKKISATDQIKASAKQRRQEKRLENDLQSILSQHNRRIQSNRRLQA